MISQLDGGPYITGGIGISKDPEFRRNIGMYRLMT
jgi:UbiD family decarboxylase